MILSYVTCKDEEEAKNISKTLLEKKLIACANYFPIKSMYRWEGKVNDGKEIVLLLKTLEEKFEEIKKEIKKIHSYDNPCIIQLDVKQANEEFLEWIKKEVKD